MTITSGPEFATYWTGVRARTRKVILCIPPAQLEWAPQRGRWTFGDIVRHLAGIERDMYGENVQGQPSRYPGHDRGLADGFDAVLAFHDRKHEEANRIFAALTPEQLQRRCPTPSGIEMSTWKWLRAMVEHEAHHRGQLYLMLGMLGVATPPLYGLTEEEVRARAG